jgi:hypothetical protein
MAPVQHYCYQAGWNPNLNIAITNHFHSGVRFDMSWKISRCGSSGRPSESYMYTTYTLLKVPRVTNISQFSKRV